MIDLVDGSQAPSSSGQDDAASSSFADLDADLSARLDAAFGDRTPDVAAAPDVSQDEGATETATLDTEADVTAAQPVTGDQPATEAPAVPSPEAAELAETRRQLAEAQELIRASQREAWERQQAESAAQEERWFKAALAGAKQGRDAARKEVREFARNNIIDPDDRQAWIDAQDADIDARFFDPEIERITAIREQRVQGQARATIEQIGRGPFAQSLISKEGSGLTGADLGTLLAPVQTNNGTRPPTGGEIVARATQLKSTRATEALHAKVRQLEALVARGKVQQSGATALPGTGMATRPTGGFDFAQLDTADAKDSTWDEGLDYLMSQMGFGGQ